MTAPRRSHPIFARCYARLSQPMERDLGEHRRELLAGVSGRVVEVGAGNGMNFAHYPLTAAEVVALEPEPYLRRLAERAAAAAAVPVTVRDGIAEATGLGDGEFDVAIASLVLCSVAEQATALAELRRVLRPGGELRFLEHVRAEGAGKASVQAGLDRSGVWPFFAGGCHCSRDTLHAIEAAGFEIEGTGRFDVGPAWTIANPFVRGVARART